ncbi:MAG: diphosphomevalonate decarboxylase [Candidatus Micrarchaeota archaeon]|nr:diphosphomevalonate decarboxylase [Candidatus Micrarchaeota archaeon]
MSKSLQATAISSPNIAFVKYWGKRDSALNLPTRNSLSMTLGAPLETKTTVTFDPKLGADTLLMNGKAVEGDGLARACRVLDAVRKEAKLALHASISSSNSFPTGTGIASSASGFAALASAAWAAAGLKWDEKKVSAIARIGSGSASRSIAGGFVIWEKGKKPDGWDSFASSFAPPSHWPELRDLVVVLDDAHKKVGSNAGMQDSVKTSKLYPPYVKEGDRRVEKIKGLILSKNLPSLLEEIMAESDALHAVMADTTPPLYYMNENSKKVAAFVRQYNARVGKTVVGYTFDAGPNAHLITTADRVEELKKEVSKLVPVKAFFVSAPGPGVKVL